MHFAMLGPLTARAADGDVDLGGRRQRRLLALLLIRANTVVATDTLFEELWSDQASGDVENAQKSLWVSISRLRTALEPDRPRRTEGTILLTRPPGYLLSVDPDDVDALRFAALAAEGHAVLHTDARAASELLAEALDLWRGSALEEFMYEPFAAAEIRRLEELRLACLEDRIDADLRLGRSHTLVAELQSLVEAHPLRQRMVGHLMSALHRCGRQGEALRAFTKCRRHLRDELGLDPTPSLVDLERRILDDDPTLHELQSVAPLAEREHGLQVRGDRPLEQVGSGSSRPTDVAEQPTKKTDRTRPLVAAVVLATVGVGAMAAVEQQSPDGAPGGTQVSVSEEAQQQLARDLIDASERARSLEDSDAAVLFAARAIRESVGSESVTSMAVDATHWALQDLGAQYPVGPDAPVAVRVGPDGPTGVFVMTPHDLVEHAEAVVDRDLTTTECASVWSDLSECPPRTPVPETLQIVGGDDIAVDGPALAGTMVTLADFSLTSEPGLIAELTAFTEATGIEVDLTENTTADDLARLVAGDLARPDVFAAVGPLIPEWARDRAIDIERFVDREVLLGDYGDYLLHRPASSPFDSSTLSRDSTLSVPIDLDAKGLVFYPKAAFEAAGYEVPSDWSGLMSLSREIVSDGRTPWCFSFGAGGPFAGFPGTDLLDSLVVRTGGLETYDAWVSGEVGFSDPAIGEAGRLAEELIGEQGFVRGGRRAISTNQFTDDMLYLTARDSVTGAPDPECWLLHQGYFMFGTAGPEIAIGSDIDAFPLPPIDDEPVPLVVNGTFASGLTDRPEVRALLEHFASPSWGEVWASTPGAGFLPANGRFDATAFDVDDPATGPARAAVVLIGDAIAEDRLRLDGSGLMPPPIGFVDDAGPGSFFRGVVDWSDERRSIDQVFTDIDADWDDLRLAGD